MTKTRTDLHEIIQAFARRRGALDAEEAQVLRDVERFEVWKKLGYPSMAHYLEATLGYAVTDDDEPESSRGARNPTAAAPAQTAASVMKRAPPDS